MNPGPRIPALDLRRQYRAHREALDAAIQGVLESGRFILGPQVEAFEREFARYCGASFAVGVASGTEALQLALRACGVGPGDEVITVSYTAVPTVNAISLLGAIPLLVDIDATTYTMAVDQVEARIGERTKALLPVHLYGHPADLEPLRELAQRHGLHLIEDACQAHGAAYRGRKVGALGDAGCFSFYPTKNLGAYGDGGMVITQDAAIAQQVRLLRHHGQKERYLHLSEGYNSRLDELQAAILLAKLPHLEAWNRRRRELAARYGAGLSSLEPRLLLPTEAPWAQHCYHLYVVRTQHRDDLQRWLNQYGMETLIHYPVPVHLQPAYRHLGLGPGSLPTTEQVAQEVLSLPLFPELKEEEVDEICGAIRAFFQAS